MLINLTDILTTEGKSEEKQLLLELGSFAYQGSEYHISSETPLVLKLANIKIGKVSVQGSMQLTFAMSCDRCLQDVEYKIVLDFDRQVTSPDHMSDTLSEDELEEQNFMEGYQLNAESLVSKEIMLNWPMKVLCREECKGICKQCGMNLNEGTCECDTFIPDPRMANIKDIFCAGRHTDKEV